jgi:hypothetical protein
MIRRRLIQILKRREPPGALIDARLLHERRPDETAAINLSGPRHMAERGKPRRPFALEQRLSLPVPDLLAPIALHARSPVVPDHRRRAEAHGPASILQPPADIDVIAGRSIDPIEPADRGKARAPERHVAARHVLGDFVGQKHMQRAARRIRDALADPAILRRDEIRTANTCVIGA